MSLYSAFLLHRGWHNFLLAEGFSEKGDQDGGRWGVGKTVFPAASAVHTYFALTARQGHRDPVLLMGRSMLQHHTLKGERNSRALSSASISARSCAST